MVPEVIRRGDLVATMAHETCALMVAHSAAERGVFVVTSPVLGVGKTRSTLHAANSTGRPVLHLVLSPASNSVTVNAELLASAGASCPRHAPLWESTAEVVGLLDDLDAVVVVDDAHRLSVEALAHLEVLHRRSSSTLGLVGGPTLARRHQSSVELFDRVERWVEMTPLNRTVMIDSLMGWHQVFRAAPRRRLVEIDAAYARGRWRRWQQFLTAALRYTRNGDQPLTDDVIDHALTALGWQQRPDPQQAR